MDPYSGQVYENPEDAPPMIRKRLVQVEGRPEDIKRLSDAARRFSGNRQQRRRMAKQARRR